MSEYEYPSDAVKGLTIQDFIKAKEMLVSNYTKYIDLAICATSASMPSCTTVACNEAKNKEKTMYDEVEDMDYDTPDSKLTYLQSRLNTIRYHRDNQLEKEYGLRDDDRPKNFNEFMERLSAGKYLIDEKNKTRLCYSPTDYLRWRDPSVKEDQEGYEKAHKALSAASTDAFDTIVVMSDDATRLSALKEFAKTAATIQ